jgi:hypothetical protein
MTTLVKYATTATGLVDLTGRHGGSSWAMSRSNISDSARFVTDIGSAVNGYSIKCTGEASAAWGNTGGNTGTTSGPDYIKMFAEGVNNLDYEFSTMSTWSRCSNNKSILWTLSCYRPRVG